MRKVDFYALPRAVQERFLASTTGASPPLPLALRSGGARLPVGWILSAVAALVALFVALRLGYGDARSSLALAPATMMIAYAVACWWLFFSVFKAIGKVAQAALVPFRRGTYLFPGGVVAARSARIEVTPLSDLVRAELVAGGASVRLSFKSGGPFELPVADRARGPAMVEALEVHRQKLVEALAAGNQHDVALLDPLIDTGIHSPLMPSEPLRRRVPGIVRHAPWLALLPALGLAWPLFTVRNSMSEERFFTVAHAENTPESYRTYLAAGGDRREVHDVLLPRAELAEARKTGSSAAVAKVVEGHAGTSVRAELELALREMLLAEIAAAKKVGTATAVRELGARIVRRDLVEGELAVALHDVYLAALERYKKEARQDDAELVPFVKRLLTHAERNGPRVEVRFRRALRPTVAAIDEIIKKNPYYPGPDFLPSRYFTPEYAAVRETLAFERLRARFAAVFPKEILELVRGAPIEDPTATYPAVTVPTLFFSHETLMGGAFAMRRPAGVFAGVGVVFEVSFRIPNRPNTLEFQLSVWQIPDLAKIQDEKLGPEQVYEWLATTAFERCSNKLLGRWFEKP